MTTACRRGGSGCDQTCAGSNGAVAIDAIDFDGGARFAVNFSVAVIVLAEMAIGALHSLFQMNVGQVNGFAETIGIVETDLLAVFVEPVAFAIMRVDAAIDPAMAVKIGKLRGLELLVEFRAAGLLQEFFVDSTSPRAAAASGFFSAAW